MERPAEHLDDRTFLDHAAELRRRELDRVERVADPCGENVSRFGVDSTSIPPGRSTRAHSVTKPRGLWRCSITWNVTTASKDPSGKASDARSPVWNRTLG